MVDSVHTANADGDGNTANGRGTTGGEAINANGNGTDTIGTDQSAANTAQHQPAQQNTAAAPAAPPHPNTVAQEALLTALESDLSALYARKRAIDKDLLRVERSVYNLEQAYLTDTAQSGGNIIAGFDNYLNTSSSIKKKLALDNSLRLFSMSSSTHHLAVNGSVVGGSSREESNPPGGRNYSPSPFPPDRKRMKVGGRESSPSSTPVVESLKRKRTRDD
ncbi:histone acetyltransferase subunit NuA4-domain-containing protein [Cladochytrium replicatum]|nr:histone acetyltransferase subunit NuA4-domain-containing protein [Cladochytrium replicatum]